MINLAVINIKDVVKYLVKLITIIVVVVGIARYFSVVKENKQSKIQLFNYSLISCLDQTIPAIKNVNNAEVKQEEKPIYEKILDMQIGMTSNVKEKGKEVEKQNESITQPDNEKIEEAKTGVETKVVEEKNSANNKYTNTYGSVTIKNESKYNLTEDMLVPNVNVKNKNIIIFQTHTCESYTQTAGYEYKATGNYRTTDMNFNVVRVGTELEKYLKNYGYNVIHDATYHDFPSYTGSYGRSFDTVKNLTSQNPEADIIFDIHRDAVGSGDTYGPTVKIGEETAAQIMFVIGTDGGGLEHPNWNQNLKFAVKMVEKGNELYPGLFKPIMVRNTRYNQNLGKAASIIEVGATANTLDQCLNSMKYFSKVLNEVIK